MADIFDLFRQIGQKDSPSREPISWMIAGLGNPGEKYRITRHNAGFLAIDYLSQKYNIKVDRLRFRALSGEGTIGGHRVLLLKPETFMNSSGEAIAEAAKFYKLPADHVLVISDDITQAVGRMRLRKKGSAGGHNGLKSIIEQLGSEEFPRLRMGIGEKPHPDYDLAAWVLSEFGKEEQAVLFRAYETLCATIRLFLDGKTDEAVTLCNSYRDADSRA